MKSVAIELEDAPARKAQPARTKGTDAVKIDLDGRGFPKRILQQ